MRVLLASDDSGSLKELVFNKGTNTAIQTALQPFHVGIHMSQGLGSKIDKFCRLGDTHLLLARRNGSVELVSEKRISKTVDETKEPQFDVAEFEVEDALGDLFDQPVLDELQGKSKKRSHLEDEFVELYCLPQKQDVVLAATKSGQLVIIKIDLTKSKVIKLATHKLKAPLDFVTLYDSEPTDKLTLAYGGEENLIKLVQLSSDFESLSQIWAAKNVPFDSIGLRVPVWDVALRFLPQEDENVYRFISITKYGHLRKYSTDVADCRPFQSVNLLSKGEQMASCVILGETSKLGNALSTQFDNIEFMCTDIRRDVYMYNGKGRLLRKIGKGDITGFPACIASTGNYLLQGGMDRYLRIFDLRDFAMVAKIFTGGKISTIILVDDIDYDLPLSEKELKKQAMKRSKRKLTADEDAVENEDLWEQLEVKKSKRSKASL